jgi:hypothetical protein
MTKIEEFEKNIWIGDSGASCHYCNDDKFLYDFTEEITVGNGNLALAKKMGKLRSDILQKNGEKLIVKLQDVKYISDLWVNLCLQVFYSSDERMKRMKANVSCTKFYLFLIADASIC